MGSISGSSFRRVSQDMEESVARCGDSLSGVDVGEDEVEGGATEEDDSVAVAIEEEVAVDAGTGYITAMSIVSQQAT